MPIKWSISNSDTKAVITMKFEDYSPEIQAKLMEIGNAAADAVESQESPAEGIPRGQPKLLSRTGAQPSNQSTQSRTGIH